MLLSIESSAVSASASLSDADKVIKSEFVNAGLTHSETLLPMIKRVMSGYSFDDIDTIATSVGPGSFTGVRIGIATVKGLAFDRDIDCVGVSTLEAIAYNFIDEKDAVICAVMDARRLQFYNALFRIKDGVVSRLCDDRAISVEDLKNDLKQFDSVIVAGDGATLCCDNIGLDNVKRASDGKMYQNAVGVSLASKNKEKISAKDLMPVYLRLSQAERELKLKKQEGKG